jgi:medium-chain acyl-[acyl-carrier-protein] hydrolase
VFRDQTDLPFAFYGHSFGSMIAFELARELRRRNLPGPLRLFVAASRAPDRDDPHPPVHNLPEPEFLATMCTRFKAIPEAILADRELLRLFVPVMRADLEMMDTYVYTPEEPLACPISAFGGLEDVAISREDLLAWSRQTSSVFTLRMLPGDHFFPRTAQTALLEAIMRDLDAR